MRELDIIAEKVKDLFSSAEILPISGNWAKWYHFDIPDEPGEEREDKRNKLSQEGHCLECTSISGCYFINGEKTFPKYPLHTNCHCEKRKENPAEVTATCDIEKFTGYIFSEKYLYNGKKELFEKNFGYSIKDADFLKSEFDRQAKEKYVSGDYVLGKLNKDGQRINIAIDLISPNLGKIQLISGWMVRPKGRITCNTPLGDR